jgi:PAS domain S-box-containing protein
LLEENDFSVQSVTAPLDSGAPWQELALAIAGIGVWEWDFVAGGGQWSSGLCALLGLSADANAVGPDGLLHFVHADDKERYQQSVLTTLEGIGDHNLEYRVVLPDLSTRWFLDRARILRDADGQPSKMIGAITDITDRKSEELARRELERAASGRKNPEQMLIETEQRFREILDYAPVALYIKNLEGQLTFVNLRFLELFKVDYGDVILRDTAPLHSADVLAQLREHDRLVIQAGRALQFEEVIEVGNERLTYLSVKFPLRDVDGNPYAICGISADITDRKSAERILQERSEELQLAVNEINQLTYSVSHEMGSPLRGVIGNIRFLREELGPEISAEADHRLIRIEKAALKMAQLVDDLLGFSRLRRKDIRVEEIDVSHLAQEIVGTMFRQNESLRISHYDIENGITVSADRELLGMALFSLIENAFKFHRPGEAAQIAVTKIEDGFCVSDSGIGVDSLYAHKIFKPFERLHRDSEYVGTGIGLAMVKRIIDRHGGEIWVESEKDQGAKFFVRFQSPSQPLGQAESRDLAGHSGS